MPELNIVISAKQQVAGAFNQVNKGIEGIAKAASSASEKLRGLGSSLSNVGTRMSVGVTAPILGFAGAALKAASNQEQLQVAFETMLGSAEKAKSLMADITALSVETPFRFDEVVNASRSLIAFGIEAENVVDVTRRLGDVSAGVSAPIGEIAEIYGKARVSGRLFAEDINQLTGRGIPIITELANVLGVAEGEVKKLVEEGKVGFPELEKAFQNMTNEGGKFSGLMEAQSRTLGGLFSTLQDVVSVALTDIGSKLVETFDLRTKLAGAVEALDGIKNSILAFADSNPELFKLAAIFAAVAAAMGPVLVGLGFLANALAGLGPIIAGVGAALGLLLSPLGLIVAAVAAVAAAWYFNWGGIRDFTDGVISQIAETLSALGLGPVIEEISAAAATIKEKFGEMGEAISGLFSGDLSFAEFGTRVKEAFAGIGEAIGDVFTSEAFTNFSTNLVAALGLEGVAEKLEEPLGRLRETFGGLFESFSETFGQVASTFQPLADAFGNLQSALGGVGETIAKYFSGGGNTNLGELLGGGAAVLTLNALTFVLQGLGSILEATGNLITTALGSAAEIINGLATALDGLASGDRAQVLEGLQGVLGGVGTLISGTFGTAATLVSDLGAALGKLAENVLADLGFEDAAEKVGAFNARVGEVVTSLNSTLTSAVTALVTTFQTNWPLIKSAATNATGVINDALKKIGEFLTTTLPNALNSFKSFLAKIALPNPFSGIQNAISSLGGAIESLRGKFTGIKDFLGNLKIPNPFANFSLPSIPGLATGGPVRSSGFYRVGEAGRAETVFLPRGAYVANPYQSQLAAAGAGSGDINIHIEATITNGLDMQELAYKVVQEIRRRKA